MATMQDRPTETTDQDERVDGNPARQKDESNVRQMKTKDDSQAGQSGNQQQPQADDYVIATGETHSVQELLELAFSYAGIDWKKYIEIDPKLVRPAEVEYLCGDARKAREVLGWKPEVSFRQLIKTMVDADIAAEEHVYRTSKIAA